MALTYEEIRKVVLDLLSGRERVPSEPNQYISLQNGVAEVLKKRDPASTSIRSGGNPVLISEDRDIFLEVFWDLFRQGIITLGLSDSNPDFPFFRVSSFGKKIIANQELYFFHDVSTYEKVIREQIPDIDGTTLIYLKEAMQTFLNDCYLSSSVMLGVATENSLEHLFETVTQNEKYSELFKSIQKEKTISRRLNEFHKKIQQISNKLPQEVQIDLDTNFLSLSSIIRNFRNESGHPTGKIVSREQCYINLHIFVPCNKKIYQLIDFFKNS